MQQLSSFQNAEIKKLKLLQQKSKYRKELSVVVVEGYLENERALTAGYTPLQFFIGEEQIAFNLKITENIFLLQHKLAESIFMQNGNNQIIGLYSSKLHHLEQFENTKLDLVVVAENIEKPGNLGAILRSADAVNASLVVVCDPSCDIYNPHIIRNSLGTVFQLPIAIANQSETLHFLTKKELVIFSTFMENSRSIYETNFTQPSAIILGTEHEGVDEFWKQPPIQNINIPMLGSADSLNVSVAAAVIMFEMRRQKKYNS